MFQNKTFHLPKQNKTNRKTNQRLTDIPYCFQKTLTGSLARRTHQENPLVFFLKKKRRVVGKRLKKQLDNKKTDN